MVCLEINPIILYNPRMPFPERVRQLEIERSENCGVCDKLFLPDDEIEVHSVTSLHLVHKDGRYIVTDPPTGHEALRGRSLSPNAYSPEETKDSDGVCLCVTCHQEIHRIALTQAKLDDPEFSGNTPSPKLLEEITLFFVNRKRRVVYEDYKSKENKIEIVFIEKPRITFYSRI